MEDEFRLLVGKEDSAAYGEYFAVTQIIVAVFVVVGVIVAVGFGYEGDGFAPFGVGGGFEVEAEGEMAGEFTLQLLGEDFDAPGVYHIVVAPAPDEPVVID